MKGHITFTIFFLFILGHFIVGCQKDVESKKKAPEFTLTDLSDETISLSQFRGKVVLVDFWATWCPPCRLSIPELIHVQEKYQDRGVVILGISMDDPDLLGDEYLRAFKDTFGINYRILRFNDGVVMDYFGYNPVALPTLFVIDREGNIRDKLVGFKPGALEKSILALVE